MTPGFRQVWAGNALRPVRGWFSVRVAQAQLLKMDGELKSFRVVNDEPSFFLPSWRAPPFIFQGGPLIYIFLSWCLG